MGSSARTSTAGDYRTAATEIASRDFRVRVAAALALGRSRHSEARPLLERALSDDHAAVRIAAAAALATLADVAAIPALEHQMRVERSSAVQAQERATMATLKGPASAPLKKAKYVLQLGDMRNAAGATGDPIGKIMRSAAEANASVFEAGLLADRSDANIVREAHERHIPVLLLDGSLKRLTQGTANGGVTFQATVEFSVRRVPENTLKGMLTGAATSQGGLPATLSPARLTELQNQAVGGAVQSAMRGADRSLALAAK